MSHTSPSSWSERLYVFITGMCMGAADVVPGVSGGTMAFIMGVYEDLLDAIHAFNFPLVRRMVTGKFREAFEQIPWQFILLLVGGIGAAIFSLAKIIKHLFEHEQTLLFAFFFGLIVASIFVLARPLAWNARRIAAMSAGAVVGYLIVTLAPHDMGQSAPVLFLCGAIAIMAMILPGISGSFLLLILGQYAWVLGKLDLLIEHAKAADVGAVLRTGASLIPLGLGAIVGLLVFARLLRWVLDRFHNATVAVLIGFMIGSLRKIWPWKEVTATRLVHGEERILSDRMVLPDPGSELAVALGLMLAGVSVILLIEIVRRKKVSAEPLV